MTRDQLSQIPEVAAILAQMSAADQAAMLDLMSAVADNVGTATQRTEARRDAGVPAQKYKLWNAYFSVVRFQGTVTTGGGNTTVTWVAGQERRAFQYAVGDDLAQAGFPASFGQATNADTNLTKKSETIAGDQVYIYGVSMMPSATTDIGAWSWLNDNISVKLSMDGDARNYKLGRPYFMPASGGNYGAATSVVTNAQLGAWSNGTPEIMNFYPFDEPMLWTSGGETDSNLNFTIRLERGVALTAPTTSTSPTTTGVDQGAFVDYMCRLHTSQTGARSLNQ